MDFLKVLFWKFVICLTQINRWKNFIWNTWVFVKIEFNTKTSLLFSVARRRVNKILLIKCIHQFFNQYTKFKKLYSYWTNNIEFLEHINGFQRFATWLFSKLCFESKVQSKHSQIYTSGNNLRLEITRFKIN